ncbi:malonyl-[acyl-carrier protein] O-methyltransferase BioC [Psychromonas sp. psych-6C06]|uniref:malonyl-ACP O-methyltransferase BioC n=1 Tax=Psychromonas sp. psych-6C06 TaxID=2058089 RepID=UPI000C347121|nr:malonyl-ACP O-methyltransferase BioC [Psychromonas sp. psych-6C06]PKF63853.1 malonyl-[acyl-carrier protein] O-methyltransferase BioC [Psychromonas sp. psych-6C06]
MRLNIDKKAVQSSFSKAAPHYDQFAQLQRDIGEQLLHNVVNDNTATATPMPLASKIVDLGCGTGYFSEKLNQAFVDAELTCFDLSEAMLKQTQQRSLKNVTFEQGDIDQLPFANESVDIIYSNLVVQWSENLKHCLQQIKKALSQDGKAYISTLLSGTLFELTEAWKQVDDAVHTNRFLALEEVNLILSELNFSKVQIKTETRTLQYDSVIEVMRALKGIGANHVHRDDNQNIKPTGKDRLIKLDMGYAPFKNAQGKLNLTYQVCYIEVLK